VHRLSSNTTLFLKIFLPVFWTTIVLMMTLVSWFAPDHYFGGLPIESLRYAFLLVLVAGSATFLLLFWPLKRVESDGEYIYVSNYFKTARYSWEQDVEGFYQQRHVFYRQSVIELNGVGTFGRKIRFMASKRLLADFRERFPGKIK
jgi:hypothetical protein